MLLNPNAMEKNTVGKASLVGRFPLGNVVPRSQALLHVNTINSMIIMFTFRTRESGNEAKPLEWNEAHSGMEPILTHTALNHLILNLGR